MDTAIVNQTKNIIGDVKPVAILGVSEILLRNREIGNIVYIFVSKA